jgi:minor extracellular protease Epr
MKRLKLLFIMAASIVVILSVIIFFFPEKGKVVKQDEEGMWGVRLVIPKDKKHFSHPIKVAILDSGINKHHQEFEGITFEEFNAIHPGEPIEDEFGHGTAIAGIIAAQGKNMRGVFQKVELFDVKVLDDNGKGKVEHVIRGIQWCMEQKVDIIHISFGFQKNYEELHSVIQKAVRQDIVFVAAAGNTLGTSVDYPAKYKEVLSVASINEELKRDPLSAKGKIDYSAPGVNIQSTNKDGGYSIFHGTSFSAAFTTGAIACLKSQESSQSIELKEYTMDLGKTGYDDHFGHGVLICR